MLVGKYEASKLLVEHRFMTSSNPYYYGDHLNSCNSKLFTYKSIFISDSSVPVFYAIFFPLT